MVLLDPLYVGNSRWGPPQRGEPLALAINMVALHAFREQEPARGNTQELFEVKL